jgi:hypothetical protein
VDQINADPRKLALTSKKEELSANSTGIRRLSETGPRKCEVLKKS